MKTNEIVNMAITYIMKHIDENIMIEDVAEHCHFSKYYFSRIFKKETGESIYAFIKRLKLEQSAFRLKVERERTITDIGFDYGYCPSNYSQVFKKHHNESPIEFRNNIFQHSVNHPFYPHAQVNIESFEECSRKISIETIKDQFVIYERRIGNYNELIEKWAEFTDKYKKYIDEKTVFLERTFDDPSITSADKCIYDICMTVDKNCYVENTCVIPGGKFAVYHYKGFPEQIYTAYQNMFQVWFPVVKKRIDNRYGFDIYNKIDCDSMYMELDICIPIK